MALSANTVWEINPGGADTNSGGFVTGASGTDYSQQAAVQYTLTAMTTVGISATIATTSASADMVGNIINITAGTNFTVGFYQILSVSVGVSITVDRNATTSVGSIGTGVIGGAFASLGQLSLVIVAQGVQGMGAFIKNTGTPISITSVTANISNGTYGATIMSIIQGYTSNRIIGNTDSAPIIQTNVASATQINGGGAIFQNIIFDGHSQTACKPYSSNVAFFQNCTFMNFNSAPAGSAVTLINCTLTSNSTTFLGNFYYCEAYGNTATPFNFGSAGQTAVHCLSYNNTGASTDGFSNTVIGLSNYINCTAYGNGRDGFRISIAAIGTLINCYAESNSANGFTISGNNKTLINCGSFNNSGSNFSITGSVNQLGTPIAGLTTSAFVAAAMNNFALNATSGGGAILRGTGFPALFPRGITTSFTDIGASQHQDSGGSSVFNVDINNVAIVQRMCVSSY